ncbi:hypothetical protein HY732_00650 [Candidatus Uhrbacteria bacterium]|nr:hypothetical protein [Candidatus Uhrbacteria bacterium]
MPAEPSRPDKSIFDHPEIPELNSIEKIMYIAEMLSMRGVHWDSGIWKVPMDITNLSKIGPWLTVCQREGLKIVDITKDMDPVSATPWMYFKREDAF